MSLLGREEGRLGSAADSLSPRLGLWLAFSPLLGCAALLLFSLNGGFAGGANFQSVFGVGLMVGAASTLVGAIIGFLFGLPRVVELSDTPAFMTSSTNLEQISDWLTKILV